MSMALFDLRSKVPLPKKVDFKQTPDVTEVYRLVQPY